MTAELIQKALAMPPDEVRRLHASHVNPTYIEALGMLGYGRDFVRGEGCRLWDAKGTEYLDFVASYGTLLLGHNHPDVRAAIEEVLRAGVPGFLQVAPQPLLVAVAARLARLSGQQMVYLASSGSEAVEGAMKLARAATSRPRFVAAERGYHGMTFGALSVSGHEKHRAPFEPLLPGCAIVPWGDPSAIEREVKKRDVAAVVLEPMQGEGGMRPPPPGYLAEVARVCRRYGTLLILDEIQTGLGRTGKMFGADHDGVVADVVCVAKGLSGGLVPISAYLTRKDIWQRAYGTLARYDVHSATFSGGAVACAAALATLEVLERDRLPAHAAEMGTYLGEQVRAAVGSHRLIREVRGRGLLWGIELKAPAGTAGALVAQWLVVGLMNRGIVTQVGTQAADVVRVEPPLIVDKPQIDRFARALSETLAEHSTGVLSSLAGAARELIRGKLANHGDPA
ncbi:MAG: aspartate aminotransferase family protein [Polyangiales bacterium]